jgi:hypothetical protein
MMGRSIAARMQKTRIRPQYGRNALNIEPIIDIGFSESTESNITALSNTIGRKKMPYANSSQNNKSVRSVKI